jgi:hypothetical protein
VRILGWLLAILGSILVIFMGGLGIILAGIIGESGQLGKSAKFTGGPEDVLVIFCHLRTRDFVRFGGHSGRSVADLVWQA